MHPIHYPPSSSLRAIRNIATTSSYPDEVPDLFPKQQNALTEKLLYQYSIPEGRLSYLLKSLSSVFITIAL